MYKVLIVDDDRAVRYDLKKSKVWGDLGFIVASEATNGHEALQKIEEAPFDLIIIDIKMPKIDGIAFLTELRNTNLDLCVVILSGYSTFEYARQGIVLGAFDYLLKPIENSKLSEVLSRVRMHLDEKYKSRENQLKISKQLEESIPSPISKQDEIMLFKLISQEPDKAPYYARELAARVSKFHSEDSFKTSLILDCLLANVRDLLFSEKPWLKNLQTVRTENKTKLQDMKDHSSMLESFVSSITDLASFVKKLHLNHSDSVIKRLCEYVIENADNKINVETAAAEFGFSSSYLGKVFRQKTGEGFVDFITTIKMEKAKALIRSGKYKNYEISDMLGYKSQDYFCSLFKMHTNMTPTDYKKSLL